MQGGGFPPPPQSSGPLNSIREFLDGVRRATGLVDSSRSDPSALVYDMDRDALFDDSDEAPLVLVIGATGRTGRIVVRKLVLRGYRVRVLVRDLYSSTLDILGTGVEFVKGDLQDYDSLLEATVDVDKIICAAGITGNGSDEFNGVSKLIRSLQDSRVADFGSSEATKRSLFHFGEEKDLNRWTTLKEEEFATPTFRASFSKTKSGRVAFLGQVYSSYSGFAEVMCLPAKIGLGNFAGLILRCVGDGKTYTVVVRTSGGSAAGIEYYQTFHTKKHKWNSVRLPLSGFKSRPVAIKDGNIIPDTTESDKIPELNRNDIRQIALQYSKPTESPEKDDGRFYLGVDYLKAYREQDEPDFIFISCAKVSSRDCGVLDGTDRGELEESDGTAWKYLSEKRLRQSGLTYTIVRPGIFTDLPGGNKAFTLEQGTHNNNNTAGNISRADVAEIAVRALLDPRACNVTFDAFESMYAPTATTPSQDVSSMLSRLEPNT